MLALVFVAGAFLLGSVPFAILVSKAMKLPDPRTYGSSNPGATNVLRSGNKLAAVLTLLGDAFKGWLAVFLAHYLFPGDPWVTALAGIAVFLGHVFSVFLQFKGGKGVATALGVLLALKPMMALVALGVWLAAAAISRYSSVAALSAAVVTAIFALFVPMHGQYVFATVVISGLLIWRHVPNIMNLMAGTETKIGAKK